MVEEGDPEKGNSSLYPHKAGNHEGRVISDGESKDQEIQSIADADSDCSPPLSPVTEIEGAPVTADHPPRSKSNSSSVRSRPMSVIPRSKRRGLLGRFTIIPEVERPIEYKRKQKWLITMFVALAAAAAPMGSAIFYRRFYKPISHMASAVRLILQTKSSMNCYQIY